MLSDLTSTATGICDGLSPVLLGCSEGGGTVVLVITDNGESATLDQIAMTIKDKNGAVFYQTSASNLLGGNIQVPTSTTITFPTRRHSK